MAIFNSNDSKYQNNQETHTSTTIITIGSSIKGEMNLECKLFVDGEFEGTIHSKNSITVGKNGKVNGEIHAHHLIVQGEVVGSVYVDKVEIKPQGKISATVESKELIIEPKGLFEGSSIIVEDKKDKTISDKLQSKKS